MGQLIIKGCDKCKDGSIVGAGRGPCDPAQRGQPGRRTVGRGQHGRWRQQHQQRLCVWGEAGGDTLWGEWDAHEVRLRGTEFMPGDGLRLLG